MKDVLTWFRTFCFLGGFLSLTSFVHYFLMMHWFFGSFPASFVGFNRTIFCLHIKFCLPGSKVFYTHLGVPRKTKQLCFFCDTKSDFFLYLKYHHVMKYLHTHKAPFWVIYGCTTWLAKVWYNELWLVRSTCYTQLYHCLDWREVPDS